MDEHAGDWFARSERRNLASDVTTNVDGETTGAGDDPSVSKSLRGRVSWRKARPSLPPDELRLILEGEIAKWARKGWRVTGTAFGRQAILSRSKWSILWRDLLLVLFTAGLWLIYMLYRALIGRSTSIVVIVDRFGTVKSFRRTDDASDAYL